MYSFLLTRGVQTDKYIILHDECLKRWIQKKRSTFCLKRGNQKNKYIFLKRGTQTSSFILTEDFKEYIYIYILLTWGIQKNKHVLSKRKWKRSIFFLKDVQQRNVFFWREEYKNIEVSSSEQRNSIHEIILS